MTEQHQPELFMTVTKLADRCEKWNRGLQCATRAYHQTAKMEGAVNITREIIMEKRKACLKSAAEDLVPTIWRYSITCTTDKKHSWMDGGWR